jgi:hypothetical protein
MKYIYSLSLLLLLLTSCGKDEKKAIDHSKTDWAFYKLNGEISSISQKSYETLDGKTKGPSKQETPSEHNYDMTFNEEGMLIMEKKWVKDTLPYEEVKYKGREVVVNKIQYAGGVPSLKTDYVYDEKGKNNLSITRRNGNNTPFDKVVMKYKNNKIIEKITYNEQQNPSNRIIYSYDGKGNLTGENYYGATDVILHKTEYKYNDKNQKMLEIHYTKDGNKEYETHYTYSGDKIASAETYNAKGELSYIEKSTFDNKGNITSQYTFDKFDGLHVRQEYKYDNKGNNTEWIAFEGETITNKASYGYDKYGNLTKVLTIGKGGKVIEDKAYNYEYNKKGNWIKKVFISNGRPAIITERTISYFND